MNALDVGFGFTITDGNKSLSLRQGEHFRIYSTGPHKGFGEDLTKRQIDLIRIAMSVHIADSWIPRRRRSLNGLRNPIVDIEVLDLPFWSHADSLSLLKECVDFVSGGDEWCFRFSASRITQHDRRKNLFGGIDTGAVVSLYSGGLDSASGLAARMAAESGRLFVPVTVRHQMQKSKLIRGHFGQMLDRGIANRRDLNPFHAGAFIRNGQVRRQFDARFREITHRCRPFLFMSVAGLVADFYATPRVEVFESGVGSINFPLVPGPADYRTTRSTHPHFLRLISRLVSHVNGAPVEYVLPFASQTKAEMVTGLRDLGLEKLARDSVSCILHPLRRKGWQQCGHCPACVFRRQAMITAGIAEAEGAYAIDLFATPESGKTVPAKRVRAIKAFHRQIARIGELDVGNAPACFKRYLRATHAVSTNEQLAPHVEVYRRYREEWLVLIADAIRRGLPWVLPARPFARMEGAIP